MLPWLPPFCFTQDPQYTLVNLHHNQPYNLSKSLRAVIFIEFLIMLQITGDMILWLSWWSFCGASQGAWSSCMGGKGVEGQVCQQKSQWTDPRDQSQICFMNKALLVHFYHICLYCPTACLTNSTNCSQFQKKRSALANNELKWNADFCSPSFSIVLTTFSKWLFIRTLNSIKNQARTVSLIQSPMFSHILIYSHLVYRSLFLILLRLCSEIHSCSMTQTVSIQGFMSPFVKFQWIMLSN